MVYTMPALVLEALMKRTKRPINGRWKMSSNSVQNILLKRKERGQNRFLRHIIFYEFQLDFLLPKNDLENQHEFRIGLVLTHIFSKYATLIPTKSKQPPDVLAGLMEGLQKMGKKPKLLYSDEEGRFKLYDIMKYLETEKNTISSVFAERFIRS